MRRLTMLSIAVLHILSLDAQSVATNVNLGIRKTFRSANAISFDLREQLQINPIIHSIKKGDLFLEEGFWQNLPLNEKDNDEMDDSPLNINMEWRLTSTLLFQYRPYNWIALNTSYALFFNGEEFRHTTRSEVSYKPLRHGTTRRKVDIGIRSMFQYAGRPDQAGKVYWRYSFVPRIDTEVQFKKNHYLSVSNQLNANLVSKHIEFDRWRISIELIYNYLKKHRFKFGYQYQKWLQEESHNNGLSFTYEVRL